MDAASTPDHWDHTYAQGDVTRSWYQAEARDSLQMILARHSHPVSLVDVGGGAGTLVDGLIAAGWRDLTVTDLSSRGLATARGRLGGAASLVTWIQQDIRAWSPVRRWHVWHDRAVLHFMTTPQERAAYHRALLAGTTRAATVVIGTFGPEGPTSCSGLPVTRYGEQDMAAFLGPEFRVMECRLAVHTTPTGAGQEFLWTLAQRAPLD